MSTMNKNRQIHHEPIFNISDPAPFIVAGIILMCHLGFVIAPDAFKQTFYAANVLAARDGNVFLSGRPIGNIPTLITHTLLHGDWTHVLLNAGFIVAFGVITIKATKNLTTPIFGRLKRGPVVFFGIFLAGALFGGLLQWAFWVLTDATVNSVGASTGGAALFASAGWAIGGKQRMIGFIAVMVAFDAFVIFAGGASGGFHNPAWAGHLGGFLAGALLAPKLLIPGGVNLKRLR